MKVANDGHRVRGFERSLGFSRIIPSNLLVPAMVVGILSGCASQSPNTEQSPAAPEVAEAAMPSEVEQVATGAPASAEPSETRDPTTGLEQVVQVEKPANQDQPSEASADKAPAAQTGTEKAVETVKAEADLDTTNPDKEVLETSSLEKNALEESEQAQGERAADAMMASLAKKDKFAVISAPAEAAPAAEQSDVPDVNSATEVAVEKPATILMQKALDITKADLPVTIELWTLKEDRKQAGNPLVLTTPTWQMGDGDYLSQIWLTLTESHLAVHSSSDIDPEIPGTGVTLGDGELQAFTRIEDNNIAILEGDWFSRMAAGGSLKLALGFFPDKKKTSPLFKSEANLDALSRLAPTLKALQ